MIFFREGNAYFRALVQFTEDFYLRVVNDGCVLYYRKPETRSAYLFGVAFIHAVEPFEDAVLILEGDAYTRIAYGKQYVVLAVLDLQVYRAVLVIIFYSVIAKVVNDFRQKLGHAA